MWSATLNVLRRSLALVRYAAVLLWVSLIQRDSTGEPAVSVIHGAWRVTADAEGTVQLASSMSPQAVLTVRTASVHRGEQALGGAVRTARHAAGLAVAREHFVERFSPVANGVEQTWLFTQPPPGSGDLTVRVDIANAQALRRGDGSLALVADHTVFRYGEALWVDARGTRTPVSVSVAKQTLLLRVPADVLARSPFPAVLDPVISTEVDVDPTVVVTSVGSSQRVPRAAFDGQRSLVVWEDHRDPTAIAVYGARIAADGTVLDPGGFPISTGANHFEPVVAFDGTCFFVAWTDFRLGTSSIYGARVSSDGEVLDPAGFSISDTGNNHRGVALASDGNQVLAVWSSEHSGSRGIWGKRFARGTGLPFDTTAQLIADPPQNQEVPDIAFGGGNFMVVFRDARDDMGDIYGIRVRPDGTPIEPAPFPLAVAVGFQDLPRVASGPNGFVAVWADERNPWPAYNDVYGARISLTGTVLDPNGRPLFEAVNQDNSPVVAFDGANFTVAWFRARDPMPNGYTLVGARFAPDLSRLGPASFDIETGYFDAFNPVLLLAGNAYLVVWEVDEGANEQLDLHFTRLRTDGTALAPADVNLTAHANPQTWPGVGFNGTRYLVAWNDNRGQDAGLFGSLVGAEPTVEPTAGFALSQRPGRVWTYQEGNPDVASDGADYFVAWGDNVAGVGELRATRVRSDGTVLDTPGILISSGPGRRYWPRVVFDGTHYFVVWADTRNGRADIFGARVSRDGTVLEPNGFPIRVSAFNKDRPAVAFDGTQFLVVWSEGDPDDNSDDVLAHRVTRDGVKRELVPIRVSNADNRQFWANVAYQGGVFLVVWHDHRDSQDANAAARVTADGTVLDPAGVVLTSAGAQLDVPEVVSDGRGFVVVWPQKDGGENDLWGLRLEHDAGLMSGGTDGGWLPFLISAQPASEQSPKLASNQQGQVLVAYSRFRAEPPLGAERVAVRTLAEAVLNTPGCPGEAPCESALCDGGACPPLAARAYHVGCDCQSGWGGLNVLALLAVLSRVRHRTSRRTPRL